VADPVRGWKELDRKLAALGDAQQVRKILRSSAGTAVTPVVQSARRNVPRGTRAHKTYKGRLVAPGFASRSIKKRVKIVGGSIVAYVGVRKEAFYALFFEGGTQYMRAQPWLEPALKDNKAKVLQRFGDGIEKWIRKVAR